MKKCKLFTFILILSLLPCLNTIAQSGELDPTFANDGIFSLNTNFADERADDIALTTDGKILALVSDLSEYGYPTLLRFLPNGTPDSSFGNNGTLIISLDEDYTASALKVDPLNRIVVFVQDNQVGSTQMYVYRYLEDGSKDTDFDNDGRVKTKLSYGQNAMTLQADGKIIIAGVKDSFTPCIQRLNENGSSDMNFGSQGILELNIFSLFILGIATDVSGRILLTGIESTDMFVTRLLEDGNTDMDFGNNGYFVVNDGATELGKSIEVLPDNKILVAGSSEENLSSNSKCWRLLDDGSLDASFGNNGEVTLFSGMLFNSCWFLLPGQDGSLIIGGNEFNGTDYDVVLYKLLNDGSIDAGFGTGGLAGKTFNTSSVIEINAVQTDSQKILLCGTKWENGNNQLAISQFLPDGEPDISFADNATVTMRVNDEVASHLDKIYDFAFLPGGKIVTGASSPNVTIFHLSNDGVLDVSFGENGLVMPGRINNNYSCYLPDDNNQSMLTSGNDKAYMVTGYLPVNFGFYWTECSLNFTGFLIYKFNADGTIDSTYGANGTLQPEIPGGFSTCLSIALQPDGKLLLAGTLHVLISDTDKAFIVRLNPDGTKDLSFGNDGMVTMDWVESGNGNVAVLELMNDGRILLAEGINTPSAKIARFNTDGSFDVTFGDDGVVTLLTNDYGPNAMKVDPNHKIVIAKNVFNNTYLMRLKEDGTIDSSFGIAGIVSLNDAGFISTFTNPVFIIQPDHKILFTGDASGGTKVVKVQENGNIDSTFATNGIFTLPFTTKVDIYAMHLDADGKILIGGKNDFDFFMARLLNDVATGSSDITSLSTLKIFPNPVSDQLIFKTPFSPDTETTIIITNSLGKVIKEQPANFSENKINMDVNDLRSGIYFLILKSSEGITSAKFIKE